MNALDCTMCVNLTQIFITGDNEASKKYSRVNTDSIFSNIQDQYFIDKLVNQREKQDTPNIYGNDPKCIDPIYVQN